MRLDLSPPPGWTVARDGRLHVAAPPSATGTRLVWSDLDLMPTRAEVWIEAVVASGLEPGERAVEVRSSPTETETGWPLLLIDDMVVVGARVTGVRLLGLYTFRQHCGSAVLRAPSEAAFFGVREAARASLVAARPDFGEVVACLADFFGPSDREGEKP